VGDPLFNCKGPGFCDFVDEGPESCWDVDDCSGELGEGEVQGCTGGIEKLICDKASVKSTVNAKNPQIKWKANVKNCSTHSAVLNAALGAACAKSGDNKGITVKTNDNQIKTIKINGKSKDALVNELDPIL
jgi:hypothetical protein